MYMHILFGAAEPPQGAPQKFSWWWWWWWWWWWPW